MKFNGTKKIMGGLALAGTLMLTGVVGFAQQGAAPQGQDGQEHGKRHGGEGRGRRGGMRGEGFRGPFGRLNLTDAQREQMKQIATRYHEAAKARRGEGRGERRGGGFDPSTGVFDEAAVRAAAQARANAHVEQEVARARMMHEMYNVLTAEQKAQLATARQQREQKRQERRQNRQERRNGVNPTQSM